MTRDGRSVQTFGNGKRQMAARSEMRHAEILEVFELLLVRVYLFIHSPTAYSLSIWLEPHCSWDLPAVLGSGRRPSSHFDN